MNHQVETVKTVNGLTIIKTITTIEGRVWHGNYSTGEWPESTITYYTEYTDDECQRLAKDRDSQPNPTVTGLPPIPWEDPDAWATYEAHTKRAGKFDRMISERREMLAELYNA